MVSTRPITGYEVGSRISVRDLGAGWVGKFLCLHIFHCPLYLRGYLPTTIVTCSVPSASGHALIYTDAAGVVCVNQGEQRGEGQVNM